MTVRNALIPDAYWIPSGPSKNMSPVKRSYISSKLAAVCPSLKYEVTLPVNVTFVYIFAYLGLFYVFGFV